MRLNKIVVALLMLLNLKVEAQIQLIPMPSQFSEPKGAPFLFSPEVVILTDSAFMPEAAVMASDIHLLTGLAVPVYAESHHFESSRPTIRVKKLAAGLLPSEGYHLECNNSGINMGASDNAGIYYAGVTFLQLLRDYDTSKKQCNVSPVIIEDRPRFSWRGLMLDCSRTFMPCAYIRKTIDRMSFYKLNVLHLHLTDDQGWRLEVPARPQLLRKAARFDTSYNEPKEFEGYYTIEDIQELIRYGRRRHVDIVPEVEAPGHSLAALNAYPELSCTGRVSPVYPYFAGPFITKDIFCAGNDGTYIFYKDVLEDLTGLFPGRYVHLGGDEAPKENWQHCSKCQSKMHDLHLAGEQQLQQNFMETIAADIERKGRRVIGWDEVMDGGKLGKEWVIMVWHPGDAGIRALRDGHDVIMTPYTDLYFDAPFDTTSLKKIYTYEPLPEKPFITASMRRHVLGIQACFWSHIDRTESRMDFQIYPRLLALAERSWSDQRVRDFKAFTAREEAHLRWMSYFNIRYASGENDYRISR